MDKVSHTTKYIIVHTSRGYLKVDGLDDVSQVSFVKDIKFATIFINFLQAKIHADRYMATIWVDEGMGYHPYYTPSNTFRPEYLDDIRKEMWA